MTDEPTEPQTFDWQVGGATDKTWQGKSRIWIEDPPGRTRALRSAATLAVWIPPHMRGEVTEPRASEQAEAPSQGDGQLTCVSTFSGIGGLDRGLSQSGFRHLAFCESDAYRRAVLAARWPGIPVYEDVCALNETAWATWGAAGRRAMGGESGGATSDSARTGIGRPGAGSVVDLLCGGFPCQDLSVAGRRAGLAGERSGLFHEFARIAESLRPRWILLENVPGLLSSHSGRDFGIVLGTLADIGYGVAWRIVDSRYFGVPQRRRRVFIVGAVVDGDPRAAAERAAKVLAVGTRCKRHPPTGTETGEDSAGPSEDGAGASRRAVASLSYAGDGGPDDNDGQAGRLVVDDHYYVEDHKDGTLRANGQGGQPRIDKQPLLVTEAITSKWAKQSGGPAGDETQNLVTQEAYSIVPEGGQGADLRASRVDISTALDARNENNHDRGIRIVEITEEIAAPLSHGSNPNSNAAGRRREDDENPVTFVSENQRAEVLETPYAHQLTSGGGKPGQGYPMVRQEMAVRRLTPLECERLQGMPDNWTAPDELGGPGVYEGSSCKTGVSDGKRYAALGDAVTVSVGRWVGEGIAREST